jgi:hypothetical protein
MSLVNCVDYLMTELVQGRAGFSVIKDEIARRLHKDLKC